MIDITRLDSGVYDFEAEPVDLEAAVLTSVDAFRQESEGASAEIEVAPATESRDVRSTGAPSGPSCIKSSRMR